jgi:hypothetical protein
MPFFLRILTEKLSLRVESRLLFLNLELTDLGMWQIPQ